MITTNLPDIPRFYTAIAEWLACFVVLLPLAKKPHWHLNLLLCGLGQVALQLWCGTWPLVLWVPGMLLNVFWMGVTLWLGSEAPLANLGYALAKAFIFAEFSASIAWQLYCIFFWQNNIRASWITAIVMIVAYVILNLGYGWLNRRDSHVEQITVGRSALLSALLTALIVFAVANLGFLLARTQFQLGNATTVFVFRTLVDLCGLLILALQADSQQESRLQDELSAIDRMFQTQYDQYTAYKASSKVIRRQFHDLKHQMAVILQEDNADVRSQYLAELNDAINTYSATISTGNAVLDTVLSQKNATALAQHIDLTCFADGSALAFMDAMDIASLFGNALDNAIESVSKIPDHDRRLIEVRIARKLDLLVLSFKNVSDSAPEFDGDIPKTTKQDTTAHGYGLKNIAYIVRKYNGQMTINVKDGWFMLKVIIPIPQSVK